MLISHFRVPIDDFAARFATVTNTYWHASLAPGNFWTGQFWDASITDVVKAADNQTANIYNDVVPQVATAQATHTIDIYHCHIWWLALLVVASMLLFLIGLAGPVLRWMTCAPDILGYASSLSRDNPYVPGSIASSAMDGFQVTRALADLKIRLADVRPDDQYGHIAVTTVTTVNNGRDGKAIGLRKGRLYL